MKKGRNTVFSTAPSNNRILQDTGNFVFDDNPLTILTSGVLSKADPIQP